jgi:hypothetical protein
MKKKLIVLPVLFALTLGLSACNRADWVDDSQVPASDTVSSETVDSSDNTGGMGMTYNGKIGIDMGGGYVLPMGGTTPQLGYGF